MYTNHAFSPIAAKKENMELIALTYTELEAACVFTKINHAFTNANATIHIVCNVYLVWKFAMNRSVLKMWYFYFCAESNKKHDIG